MEKITFTPLVSFSKAGNEIQRCQAVYKGIPIIWETYFPWNIFKKPSDSYWVDVTLPVTYPLEKGEIKNIYHEEGFGSPFFDSLEDTIKFIDDYNQKRNDD